MKCSRCGEDFPYGKLFHHHQVHYCSRCHGKMFEKEDSCEVCKAVYPPLLLFKLGGKWRCTGCYWNKMEKLEEVFFKHGIPMFA